MPEDTWGGVAICDSPMKGDWRRDRGLRDA